MGEDRGSFGDSQLRSCPVCNINDYDPVWGDKVVCCRCCGMVYDYQPEPVPYEKLHAYSMGDETDRTKATMRLLQPWLKSTALEIGFGSGDLLEALGRRTHALGIDPSKAAVEQCRLRGLSAATGSVYSLPSDKYDLIVLSHVFEHLTQPGDALSLIRSRMAENGKLYIEVPDATRHLDHITVPLQEFGREHINHFSMMLLTALLMRYGLVVVAQGTRSLTLPQGSLYPAMWVVCMRGPIHTPQVRDPMLGYLMRLYGEDSTMLLHKMQAKVLRELEDRQTFTVWGAGILAEHLLPLFKDRVTAIYDRDPGKMFTKIGDIEIQSPPHLGWQVDPLLVCSVLYGDAIEQDVRSSGFTGKVIRL